MSNKLFLTAILTTALSATAAFALTPFVHDRGEATHVIEVKVTNREQRNMIANLGYALEDVRSDRVFIYAQPADAERLKGIGFEVTSYPLQQKWKAFDTATHSGEQFHSYDDTMAELVKMQSDYPAIASLSSNRMVCQAVQPALSISRRQR